MYYINTLIYIIVSKNNVLHYSSLIILFPYIEILFEGVPAYGGLPKVGQEARGGKVGVPSRRDGVRKKVIPRMGTTWHLRWLAIVWNVTVKTISVTATW
mgnify:CR=1 FL=1